ncbi:hypothetical protein UFOVP616_36 [uncultured Caudovirales phage]|uniref:Uncharacterized protein n=1 Tax=uncultured Caudovirales phage TaxID=2100421 RepID=A0A6J5NBH5_9CAUD|nr:hypothetical protein UFOVP616_36 [uncultured Caudovirales phage]
MAGLISRIGSSEPSSNPFAVVLSDTVDLTRVAKALYVGGGGNIVLIGEDSDTALTFANVPSGYILPVRVRRILLTGTTAANILGL